MGESRSELRGRRRCATAWLVLAVAMAGCRPSIPEESERAGRLRVVCTTGQVGDLLKNVGGQRVTVETLMGPGVDPHLYKATPGDRRMLNAADVVFFSGLHLEGRLADLLEKLARQKPAYAVTEVLVQRHAERLHRAEGSPGTFDPHVWFDVSLWAECVEYVAEKLAEVDGEHAAEYRRNAAAYRGRLDALHHEVRGQLAEIPAPRRVLVTAHDAFGYFGSAYAVEVRAIQGISTADEPDLGAINELVEVLVQRGIKAVFVESSVPPRNIQSLIEGAAARGHRVAVGGELYSDALGMPDTPEESYEGVVRYNVRTICEALK